jgi:hypothetical protein
MTYLVTATTREKAKRFSTMELRDLRKVREKNLLV